MREACAISYIQYIGVVRTGLPSAARGGAPPNSPIGIAISLFASQHIAECVILRQCMVPYIYVAEVTKPAGIHGKVTLFAA
ncbi:hypothetical protein TM239_39350 [Bradyrhizobium sp. TM239]|nr:hypothetical protein TM239_39350 [Bradyrhizobium sp. TM239]